MFYVAKYTIDLNLEKKKQADFPISFCISGVFSVGTGIEMVAFGLTEQAPAGHSQMCIKYIKY